MKMNFNTRITIAVAAVAVLFSCSRWVTRADSQQHSPADLVNPLVGSKASAGGHGGNTYPAIAMPWGMNFWTPQTGRMADSIVYDYDADCIRGLRQIHRPGAMVDDYGQFALMPLSGEPVFNEDGRASRFSHKQEDARPYYYSVYLSDHNITAEVTPSERAAMMRFTYAQPDSAWVVVDAFDCGSSVTIVPEENKIVGFSTCNSGGVPSNFRNYFVITFDHPFDVARVVNDGATADTGTISSVSDHAGALLGFKTGDGEQVCARVASSFISLEQAHRNLLEVSGKNFDEVKDAARDRWNEVLGRIEISDPDEDAIRTFYSCLYRTTLFPHAFYEIDADGRPYHYSPYNGCICEGYMFTDTGFWQSCRAVYPLLNLVYPDVNEKMQAALVNAYHESGFLPEWASPGHRNLMYGNNSASVVADAYAKGLRGYNTEALWEALVKGTTSVRPQVPSTGRLGHEYYNRKGYVPADVDIDFATARTLAYAYNDWCIYQYGKLLGKSSEELTPFATRARNYGNVFDRATGGMQARFDDGSFAADTTADFSCCNWAVYHDPAGLIALVGGAGRFNQQLDSMLNADGKPRCLQGDKALQHVVYLYNYSGQPWKCQQHVRDILDNQYSVRPDGYSSDDACGQNSAWYVFSALGFYPVCPGSDQYVIGSPRFNHVKVKLPSGKLIDISAPDNNQQNCYIADIEVQGEKYGKNYLTHDILAAGADIRFRMADSPDMERGSTADALPYSYSAVEKI